MSRLYKNILTKYAKTKWMTEQTDNPCEISDSIPILLAPRSTMMPPLWAAININQVF